VLAILAGVCPCAPPAAAQDDGCCDQAAGWRTAATACCDEHASASRLPALGAPAPAPAIPAEPSGAVFAAVSTKPCLAPAFVPVPPAVLRI
jgi:hypothetical protein